MLSAQQLRDNRDTIVAALTKRNKDFSEQIDRVIALDETRRKTQNELDNNLAEANKLSKEIGDLFKSGKKDEAEAAKPKVAALKEAAKALETALQETEEAQKQLLYTIPNAPHATVPQGKTADDNVEVFSWGSQPTLSEGKKPHWELIEEYDLIDFELGTKITGAGFPVYKG